MTSPSPVAAPNVASTVSVVVAGFADQYGDALTNPDAAHDMCVPVSEAFAAALSEAGATATVVNGVRMGEFQGIPVLLCGHFAVQVGDTVYDWTARQFDEHAPVPLIEPVTTWRDRWPALGT